MNFWQQIQNAAEMGRTLPWLILIFLIASAILFTLKPLERARTRTALLLFGLSLAGLLLQATLISYGFTRVDSAYKWTRWAWRILLAFAFVNVAGAFIFEVFLAALRLRPPRFLRDLPMAFTYVVVTISVLSRDVDLTGIIATSAVLTAVIGLSFQDTLGNMMAGMARQRWEARTLALSQSAMKRSRNISDWSATVSVANVCKRGRLRSSQSSMKPRLQVAFIFVLLIGIALLLISTGSRSSIAQNREVTFSKDVAPIVYEHCASCHRPDDIAPFSILDYEDALPFKDAIRQKVVAREMPPWHADPHYGEFANAARLTQPEIDTIVKWVAQGAKQGDPKDLPELPKKLTDWEIGKPDYVLAMTQAYTVQAHSPDAYVYVTFPTKFKEDKWVQAAEIVPGNKRVVHHVIAHVLPPQAQTDAAKRLSGEFPQADADPSSLFYKQGSLSRMKMDAPVVDDGASAANGGSLFKRQTGDDGGAGYSILLASYAPGKGPDVYPEGTAKKIPAGSTVVLQIHYSSFHGRLDAPQKDQTIVGMIFAKSPPAKRAITSTVPNHFFKIPAGAANHQVTAAYTFDRDVELISYMPHMHLRGKDMKYEVVYPSGKRETLLWVPRFQFNWQTVYRLKNSLPIPKGTKIIVTAHFDNSAKNRHNPDPTKAVRWGDPSYDEMMIGWIEYTVPVEK